jgi:uncharacterized protein YoxC
VDQDNVDAMTAEILTVVMILLEDVGTDPKRIDRAIEIATRDITAIVKKFCQSGRRKGPRT